MVSDTAKYFAGWLAIHGGLLCLLAAPAAAAERTDRYTCTTSDQTRVMEHVYDEARGVPCIVRYHRNNEPPRIVWQAQGSASVCQEGVRKMTRDFEAAGYTCTTTPAGVATAPEPPKVCYSVLYQACKAGQTDCPTTPGSVCAQSDDRWILNDGQAANLDPQVNFLPGEAGKCYKVFREGQARPLCSTTAGAPNTVWTLK